MMSIRPVLKIKLLGKATNKSVPFCVNKSVPFFGIPSVGSSAHRSPAQRIKRVMFKISVMTAKFLGKPIGSFLQVVAVSINWCDVRSVDSLWLSLRMQWQGVGTLRYSPRICSVV